MYVTTEAVESFVEEHYGDQIARCSIAYGHRLMFFDTFYLYTYNILVAEKVPSAKTQIISAV